MAKARLDKLLVKRGLASCLEEAVSLIASNRVLVGGIANAKPRSLVDLGLDIQLADDGPSYVSRGAHKLLHALEAFAIDPKGRVALDVGASTGGFTDVLLQKGASKVFAIDVGYGQLAWSLRNDPRVVVLERENIRHLEIEKISEPAQLCVIDVSFISLTKILQPVVALMQVKEEGTIVALIKPQFEARKGQVGKGGVVRSAEVRQECIDKVREFAAQMGLGVGAVVESPIRGPAGNVEFLIELGIGRNE